MADLTRKNAQCTDEYLADVLCAADPHLDAAITRQQVAGLPAIEVSPLQGKLLYLLARMSGAQRVLEIGTLGGFSTIWLARAVGEQGSVISLEAEAAHVAVARENLDAAGVGARVQIMHGIAADILPTLTGPFDFVFIDADKQSNTIYLDWAAKLGREGTAIVLDNIARAGEIVHEPASDIHVDGAQRALRMLGEDPRFEASAMQTVGVKGWDGLAIAIVTGESAH